MARIFTYALRLMPLPAFVAVLLIAAPAFGEVAVERIEYEVEGSTHRGLLVMDPATDDIRAGVLLVPEWWGVNDFAEQKARELAERGYVVLVADMYGEGRRTEDAQEASRWAGEARQKGLSRLAGPALRVLKEQPMVDEHRTAAIGFCFGGTTVAEMARDRLPVRAVASFHGSLSREAAPRAGPGGEGVPFETAILVLHGGADPLVPPENVAAYVEACLAADVPLTFISFPGALHSFTNPAADDLNIPGVGYDRRADRMSFAILYHFLEMTLSDVVEEP